MSEPLRNRVADLINPDDSRHPEGQCLFCDDNREADRKKADAIIAAVTAPAGSAGEWQTEPTRQQVRIANEYFDGYPITTDYVEAMLRDVLAAAPPPPVGRDGKATAAMVDAARKKLLADGWVVNDRTDLHWGHLEAAINAALAVAVSPAPTSHEDQ